MTNKEQKISAYYIGKIIRLFLLMVLCLFVFSKTSIAAGIGDPVPKCTANDYTYDVFNVVPNGVCQNLTDTLNVKFSVLVTGNPARYDLSIGYTRAGNPTLVDIRCLTTGYDVNGGGCNDYDNNSTPVTATSDLDVSCDVDGNLLIDAFLNVDFYLNWDIDANNPHPAEITAPKCKSNAGSSTPIPLKAAKLTLVKNIINDNLGTSAATDWTLSANIGGGTAELTGTTGVTSSTLPGGEYVLSETGPAGYTLTGISCPGGTYDSVTKTLSLAPEQDITCTFTNNDIMPPNAAFKLSKALIAESGSVNGYVEAGELLTYTITLNNVGGASGAITVNEKVPAGTTFIAAGNDFVTASCIDGATAGTVCSKSSPSVASLSSRTMTFVVRANNPLTTSSIENFVIENGTTPPTCTATDNTDARCVSTAIVVPNVSLQKNSITLSDPVNGTSNPKAIPGALAEYSITATNTGSGTADNNSIVITDGIPANTALYVNDISGSGTGPIRFVDGATPSGLSYNFVSLASTTDGLSFSNDGGATYVYVPSPDADGVDTTVTNIRIATLGQFLASSGSGDPSFKVLFRVKVQ